MGISREPGAKAPSLLAKLGAWVIVFLVMLGISALLGKGQANYNSKHCVGMYDTPRCHSDRAREKAEAYEQLKKP